MISVFALNMSKITMLFILILVKKLLHLDSYKPINCRIFKGCSASLNFG